MFLYYTKTNQKKFIKLTHKYLYILINFLNNVNKKKHYIYNNIMNINYYPSFYKQLNNQYH